MRALAGRGRVGKQIVLLAGMLASLSGVTQGGAAPARRPRILGVAHAAFYVSDLAQARTFYKDLLGFEEVFSLKNDDGSDRTAFIKIDERQYVEQAPRTRATESRSDLHG